MFWQHFVDWFYTSADYDTEDVYEPWNCNMTTEYFIDFMWAYITFKRKEK